MTIIRNLLICLILVLLPSCSLVQSVVKIPASILKTAGRTVGVSNLTDTPAQPIHDIQEKEGGRDASDLSAADPEIAE